MESVVLLAPIVLDNLTRGFQSLAPMNPSKVYVSLSLTVLLLFLAGCEGMPTESNTPAVVPNPQPGAAIPGGLRIVSAHASPLFDDFGSTKGER